MDSFGYVCLWKGRRFEVVATSTYAAQQKAAEHFKCRHPWEISVVLAEKNEEQIVHVADF